MEKIPQEGRGFNTSSEAEAANEPRRSHDELITAVLAEYASPEQQEATLQAHIKREEDALLEVLGEHQEQQRQPQQGNRYQCAPEQQQQEQQAQEKQQEPSVPPVENWGVNANIQLPDRTLLRFHVGNDDPVYQWLAGKRQALEQQAMLLRNEMATYQAAAWYDKEDADVIQRDGAFREPDREYHMVTPHFYAFGKAAVELAQCEAELRQLGIEPSRSGITREVWDWFHREVVEAQIPPLSEQENEEE